MDNKEKGYKYSHSTEISILYPFYVPNGHYEKIVRYFSSDESHFQAFDFFEKNNSPFMKYIEDINHVYGISEGDKNSNASFNKHGLYCFSLKKDAMELFINSICDYENNKGFEFVDKSTSKFSNLNLNDSSNTLLVLENSPYFDFSAPSLYVFSSGIMFFRIQLISNRQLSNIDYKNISLKIRNTFESIPPNIVLRDLLDGDKELIEIFESAVLFDDKDSDSGEQQDFLPSRFQSYIDIKLKEDQSNSILDNELIANYFTNTLATKLNDVTLLNKTIHKKTGLFPGNEIFITATALVCITKQTKVNRELIANFDSTQKNYRTALSMNKFFIYLLVLHQYYYLHKISSDIRGLSKRKKYIKTLRQIMLEYSIYKSEFDFYHITSQKQYQDLYRAIYDEFNIAEFSKEVQDTTIPMENSYKIAAEQANEFVFKMLGLTTLFNLCYLLSKDYINMSYNQEQGLNIYFDSNNLYRLIFPLLVTAILVFFVLGRRKRSTNTFNYKKKR